MSSDGFTRRQVLGGAGLAAAALITGCGRPAPDAATPVAPPLPPLPDPLWRGSALELAEAIRTGQTTSRAVVEAHLSRIDAVNPQINAVVRVLREEALAAADRADAMAAGDGADDGQRGVFHGVPFTIKENIDVAGSPTTEGVPALAENLPEADAPIVARMRAAGAIPIGRTNLPDFGMRAQTSSHLHGLTRNPWNPGRTVAGSSGGEAAALATGMSPLGLGNDIGGSLRNPAHACGICSLKPSLGRLPRPALQGGGLVAGQLMAVDGPMARRIADVRAAFEVMAGPHPHDPWSVPAPLDVDGHGANRVALVPEPPGGPTGAAVAAGVRRAGEALAADGYEVEEVPPPELPTVYQVWAKLITTDFEVARAGMESMMSADAARFLRTAFKITPPGSRAEFSGVLAERHRLAAQWGAFFEEYPIVVGPVFTQQPVEVDYDIRDARATADVLTQLRFTVAGNLLGIPSAVVPVGTDGEGMPQAVQIYAARFRELACLDVAAKLEMALGTLTPIDPRPAAG